MATIVLDPGHGGYDYGAVNGSRREKDDNFKLASLVAQRLRAEGQNVVMTRTGDYFVTLPERSVISNNNLADIFVSFHRNASTNPNANGVETFIHPTAPQKTFNFATTIHNAIVNAGVQNNRGVKRENFAVLRNTTAPAILLEVGFISNNDDNAIFDKNLDAYANAIAAGILQSLNIATAPAPPSTGGSSTIMQIQQTLNNRYGAGLAVDGFFGPNTKRALVRGLQIELNRQYNAGLAPDGIFGARTKAAIPLLRRGSSGNIVYLLQAALYVNGFNIAVDGVFGPGTESAVRQFQSQKGLTADGIAGPATFEALLR